MDIDSNCPETTSHLTSKLNVTDGWIDGGFNIFFNVENSIKHEMKKNSFSKKKIQTTPPPSPEYFVTQFFF